MTEQKPNRNVEWSFSFDQIGDSLKRMVGKLGSDDDTAKTETFKTPLTGATRADIKLNLSVGRVNVYALVDSDQLMEANVTYTGEIEFTVSGEAEKVIRLGQKPGFTDFATPFKDAIAKFTNRDDLRWDIGLNPAVPLDLEIDCGVGSSGLNLAGLKLTKVDVDGGVGEIRLTLPVSDQPYKVEVDNGVGGVNVTVPDGAHPVIEMEGGIGGMTISLPEASAARLKATAGLGGISVPSRFRRVSGEDGLGGIGGSSTWETEGYALATQKISVEYSGGVGGLNVR
jgi:hypothetical protein